MSDSSMADSHIGWVGSPKVGVVLSPSACGGALWTSDGVSSFTGASDSSAGWSMMPVSDVGDRAASASDGVSIDGSDRST